MTTFNTREGYLAAFVAAARPVFAAVGLTIPAAVRVGVGWTSKGSRAKAIGECWSTACSDDGTWEIILSPGLADGPRVADVLTHELIHAAVGLACGHRGAFLRAMRALGLEGKATATTAGPGWHDLFDAIVEGLGAYPHARLDGAQSSGPKKQGTRQLKVECPCGVIYRMSRKVAEMGLPHCGACCGPMTCDALDDESEAEGLDEYDMAANAPAAPAIDHAAALVAAVRAHALANYEKSGWDYVVECWSDDEIAKEMGAARTAAGAVKAVARIVKLLGDHRAEIVATEW